MTLRAAQQEDRHVVVVGLGAIGHAVARCLGSGKIAGLRLAGVCDRNQPRYEALLAEGVEAPRVPLEELGGFDVIVEAAGALVLSEILESHLEKAQILIPCSVGSLLDVPDIEERLRALGARIIVPSGAVGALDAVRAAMEGEIYSLSLETRKAPASLADAPYVIENQIELEKLEDEKCIFDGTAREAARGFPANINVAAALALAGPGPDATRVRIIADPKAKRNIHTIRLDSSAVRLLLEIEGLPSEQNPRTSSLTPNSVISTLRGLTAPFTIGR